MPAKKRNFSDVIQAFIRLKAKRQIISARLLAQKVRGRTHSRLSAMMAEAVNMLEDKTL